MMPLNGVLCKVRHFFGIVLRSLKSQSMFWRVCITTTIVFEFWVVECVTLSIYIYVFCFVHFAPHHVPCVYVWRGLLLLLFFLSMSANLSNTLSIENNRIHCMLLIMGSFVVNMRISSRGYSYSGWIVIIFLNFHFIKPGRNLTQCLFSMMYTRPHCKHACSKSQWTKYRLKCIHNLEQRQKLICIEFMAKASVQFVQWPWNKGRTISANRKFTMCGNRGVRPLANDD